MRNARFELRVLSVLATIATLATALALGCGKPVFTDAVARRYGLSANDVRRIQFFTSSEIVLRRELTDQEKGVSGNELTIRDGVRVEEVVISSRTPCVALRVEGDFILCGFSRQHPDHALWFAVKKTDEAEGPAESRKYELVHLANGQADVGPFHPEYAKGFLVSYGGKKYRVVDGKMWTAHLLYDLDETFAKEKVRESPPGWRLSEGAVNAKQAPAPAGVTVTVDGGL